MACVNSGRAIIMLFIFIAMLMIVLTTKSFPYRVGAKYTHTVVIRKIQEGVTTTCLKRLFVVIQTFWLVSELDLSLPKSPVKVALATGGSIIDLSIFRLGCLNIGGPKASAVAKCVILNGAPVVLFCFGGVLASLDKLFPQRRQSSRYWPAAMETCSMTL